MKIGFIFILALFIVFYTLMSDTVTESTGGIGLKDADVLLYLEAVTRIKEQAAFIGTPANREDIVRETLRAYLQKKDPFSEYLTKEEYSNFKKTQNDRYVGVGMEIERNPDGRIICLPYPASPAEHAGISPEDHLEKIDGNPLLGKSLLSVAAMARGREGTKVVLTVRTGNEPERNLSVMRSSLRRKSVSRQVIDGFTLVQINAFTADTASKLKQVLKESVKTTPLIIDVRGNRGGDLHAAIDSAGLFLAKGSKIALANMRAEPKAYQNMAEGLNTASRLFVWQDAKTASAAEVFVAALTENGRAISIGEKTYGKGSRQDILELSDGSALVLTTGYLETPKGMVFHGTGLMPTVSLPGKPSATSSYLAQTQKQIRKISK